MEKACDSIDDSSSSNTDDTEKKQELQSLTEKLKSLKENDGAYNNFSGLEDGKTGSVSFIIETDEIKNKAKRAAGIKGNSYRSFFDRNSMLQ